MSISLLPLISFFGSISAVIDLWLCYVDLVVETRLKGYYLVIFTIYSPKYWWSQWELSLVSVREGLLLMINPSRILVNR